MKKIFISTVVIAFLYLVFFLYLINHNLVEETLGGVYPLSYKVSIMWSLLGGLGATLSFTGQVLVILIAIFTGLDISLSFQKVKRGRRKFTFFPGAFMGILGSGCGACGLSAVSVFGLSGSFLPFRGLEFSFLALALLILSFVLLVKDKNSIICKVGSGKR